jgi:hypothetical protein
MKRSKMVFVAQVAGMAIVTAACRDSASYQTGYDAAIRDPAPLQKFVSEGLVTPQSYCHDLLAQLRTSVKASDVDGTDLLSHPSDFLSGCLDGVQRALYAG